jgi:hypothetical protein
MNGKKTAGQPLPVLSNRPRLLKRAYSTLRLEKNFSKIQLTISFFSVFNHAWFDF